MKNKSIKYGIKNIMVSNLIFLVLFLSSCQNNQEKINQLENEITSLKAENNSLRLKGSSYPISSANNYGQSDSKVAGYYMYSDERLMEEFKDYMSDEFFSYTSFNKKGKALKIGIPYVSNISIRSIQKSNPEIFTEILKRVDKIVFFDPFGASMTIKKMNEQY